MEIEKRIEELEKRVAALEVQAQEQQTVNQTVTINCSDGKTPTEIAADLKKKSCQLASKL